MLILKLRNKVDMIHTINVSQSKNISNEVFKLNWQLEQMMEVEKIDGLADIKKRMKHARKKGKKKKRKITHV